MHTCTKGLEVETERFYITKKFILSPNSSERYVALRMCVINYV